MEELSKKKSYNILFTDIDGTLIDGKNDLTGEIIKTFEQDLEKKMKLSKLFNTILEGNNIIVLVTTSYHTNARLKLKNMEKVIEDKNKNKVLYFMSSKSHNPGLKDQESCFYDGIKIDLVEDKQEAVFKVLEYLKNAKVEVGQLYGLGDAVIDINMLLKIKELGGKTCLIADEFEFNHVIPYNIPDPITPDNIGEVAKKIASKELEIDRRIFIQKCIRMHGDEYLKYISSSEELKNLKKRENDRIIEIKNQFLLGNLTREGIVKLFYLSQLAFSYVEREIINNKNNSGIYFDVDKYNEVMELGRNVSIHVLERQPDLLLGRSIVKLFDNN